MLNQFANFHRMVAVSGCCAAAMAMISPVAAQDVFINEIHYDNVSGDVGEAVEVAGPAGTSLAGWSIALYNGSASQLSVYNTINLGGTLPNQQLGCGTLAFTQAGIQNGAPDGLALIDPSNMVVQFLSYEGALTAGSGPAIGMTSTDIGVAESSGTPVGNSLQLGGTGTDATAFAWQEIRLFVTMTSSFFSSALSQI
jgi:hypothetical protein